MPSSVDTPGSLLDRLHQPGDEDAWLRFVRLYTPLLFQWAHRMNVPHETAKDLVQDVLVVLVRKLPEFRYDRRMSFRGWLKTVTQNKWRERCRRSKLPLAKDVDPADVQEPAAEAFWEEEYRQALVSRALQLMRTDFEPATWQACWEVAVNGRPAAAVAQQLGLTSRAVYLAKSRVLNRLQQDLGGFLD